MTNMDFEKLVEVYEKLEAISSGNAMREALAEFFKKVEKEDIAVVAYLTLGKIASEYENEVLGIAEKSLLKSIALAGGTSEETVRKIVRETGDAGLAAEKVLKRKTQTLVPLGKLGVRELYEKLRLIAQTAGMGSIETKTRTIAQLLQKASPTGGKYVVRIALGTLRMGVGEMTVLDALAMAFTGEKKNKGILENAYNICPDVGVIAETIAKKGLKGLENIDIHVGRPIKMMLAQRVQELEDVAKKMPGKVAVEGKYDGERVQAHCNTQGVITLFSRRMDTITEQFPDLLSYLKTQLKGKDYVIEGEVLAVDEKGQPLPFQTLMQRRRKYEVEKYVKDVPIQYKVFDLLWADGKSFLHKPYAERIKVLKSMLKQGEHIVPADQITTDSLEKINEFFHQMLDFGYEGIMIKNLQGEYQAGTRGWNWIKWKKEYVKDLSDTLDLVVVGAFYGRGKRSGVYGALLCACYNQNADAFETVCKLGTGLTDEVLAELPEKLKKHHIDKKPARLSISKEMEPDVWFEPVVVVEVKGAEITKSPYHSLGLALRFPRFLRFREDKKAEQATTSKEIREMVK